jgi:hypothetical protein
MQRTLRLVTITAVLAFAATAWAGFGVKMPVKAPVQGDPEDVTKFVKSADGAYTDVRTISVDVPGQMLEVTDEVMGIKDFPADDAARERYAAIKTELAEATTAVKSTNVGDMRSLKEANKRVDDATDALVALMHDVTSKEGVMEILGAADLSALKAKTQGYLETDTKAIEGVGTKLAETGTTAPAATKSWTLGIPDSYTVQLTDGTPVGKKELEGLVKDGPSHLDTWKSIVQRRLTSFKDLGGKLGLVQ